MFGVVFALASAGIAQSKGLAPAPYAMLGLFLGLIGVVITACVPARPVVPPGWYSDPWRSAAWRWWDGNDWTQHVG